MQPISSSQPAAPISYTSQTPPVGGADQTVVSQPGSGKPPRPANRSAEVALRQKMQQSDKQDAEIRNNKSNELLNAAFDTPAKYPAITALLYRIAGDKELEMSSRNKAALFSHAVNTEPYKERFTEFVDRAVFHDRFAVALESLNKAGEALVAKHLPDLTETLHKEFALKVVLNEGKQAENPKAAWQTKIVADVAALEGGAARELAQARTRYAKLKLDVAPWSNDIAARSRQVAKIDHLADCVDRIGALKADAQAAVLAADSNLSGKALEQATEAAVLNNPEFKQRFKDLNTDVEAAHQSLAAMEKAVTAASQQAPRNATTYETNVTNWLQAPESLKQINDQLADNLLREISLLDVRRDDILVRKEVPPESVAHSNTLPKQEGHLHNGIAGNLGDTNVFHIAMVTQDPPLHLMSEALKSDGINPDTKLGKSLLRRLMAGAQRGSTHANPKEVLAAIKEFNELKSAIQYAADKGESPNPTRWSKDALLTATIQVGEARGGLGTTNALRVLLHSLQSGTFHVYRADPNASHATKGTASLMTEIWGNAQKLIDGTVVNPMKYSVQLLGGSMEREGRIFELNDDRRADIMHIAGDPEKKAQEIDFSKFLTKEQFKEVTKYAKPAAEAKKDVADFMPEGELKQAFVAARAKAAEQLRENKLYLMIRGKDRLGGATCSTVEVSASQIGKLQQSIAEKVAAKLDEDLRKATVAANLKSPEQLPEATRAKIGRDTSEWFKESFGPFDGPVISDNLSKFWSSVMDSEFTGILQGNAEGTSPRTIEGLARAGGYQDVGVLNVTAPDVLNQEQSFALGTGEALTPKFKFTANLPEGHAETGPSVSRT